MLAVLLVDRVILVRLSTAHRWVGLDWPPPHEGRTDQRRMTTTGASIACPSAMDGLAYDFSVF